MLLSICIPTYNRVVYLQNTLPNIIQEILVSNLESRVQICISDNCSTDNTEQYVTELLKSSIVNIHYKKLESNIGAPRNFLSSVEMSSTKYVWLMGSDDWIVQGKLATVISTLEQESNCILLGDRININKFGKIIDEQYWSDIEKSVTCDQLIEYISSCNSIGGVFSFISDIVFDRNEWILALQAHEYLNSKLDSPYIHVYILLLMLKNSCYLKYMHLPLVYNQADNDSFLDGKYFQRVEIDFEYPEIFKFVFNEDLKFDTAIKALLRKERNIFHLLKSKALAKDHEEKQRIEDLVSKYYGLKESVILTLIPGFIIKKLLVLYKVINVKRYHR